MKLSKSEMHKAQMVAKLSGHIGLLRNYVRKQVYPLSLKSETRIMSKAFALVTI